MEEKIKVIEQELVELKKKNVELIMKLNVKIDEIKNSIEHEKLEEEMEKSIKESNEFVKKISNKEYLIENKFLNGFQNMPCYFTNYGSNIKPEVINAIKKTFNFNSLSGSAIESLVIKMMDYKISESEEIKKLKEKKEEIDLQVSGLCSKLSNFECEYQKGFDYKINEIEREIVNKEKELALLQLQEGEKIENVPKFVKKRVLEDYSEQCENNFMKVFEVLEVD